MNIKLKLFGIIIFILLTISLLILIVRTKARLDYEKQGQALISLIEQYYLSYGKWPQDVRDVNWEEEMGIGPFYRLENDSTYIVYFCLGFDEYYQYDSSLKSWSYFP